MPLLKWAGGKRLLADRILPFFAKSTGRYFEPFLGGAALFLASTFEDAYLSDLNDELINFYIQVRDRPSKLIGKMRRLEDNEVSYYLEREKGLRGVGLPKAARFAYLTTLAFNGRAMVRRRGNSNCVSSVGINRVAVLRL
jgi:DNA adenine methylase